MSQTGYAKQYLASLTNVPEDAIPDDVKLLRNCIVEQDVELTALRRDRDWLKKQYHEAAEEFARREKVTNQLRAALDVAKQALDTIKAHPDEECGSWGMHVIKRETEQAIAHIDEALK